MPHLNKLIDFTVTAYIVFESKVLLAHHKVMDIWVPVGGHIELDEDPEQALLREVTEETGLEVEVVAERPPRQFEELGTTFLPRPEWINIHTLPNVPGHRHTALIYLARAKSNKAALAPAEHKALRWFAADELAEVTNRSIRYYANEALRRLATRHTRGSF